MATTMEVSTSIIVRPTRFGGRDAGGPSCLNVVIMKGAKFEEEGIY